MIEIRKAVETEKNDRKNINTDNAAHISWYLYLAKPYRTGTCGLSDTFTGPPGHYIDPYYLQAVYRQVFTALHSWMTRRVYFFKGGPRFG